MAKAVVTAHDSFVQQVLVKTNKAEVRQIGPEQVVKRYFGQSSSARTAHDQKSLACIAERLGTVRVGSWIYRVVKTEWFDLPRCEYCMELLSGSNFPSIRRSYAARFEWHCGVWLAVYHNKLMPASEERGLVFSDFTVSNIYLDFDRQCAVAIDPGMQWSRLGFESEDIVRHLNSALFAMCKRCIFPVVPLSCFAIAYALTINRTFGCYGWYRGVFFELHRELKDHLKKSKLRGAIFLLSLVLCAPIYLLLLPAGLYLLSFFRPRRPNDL